MTHKILTQAELIAMLKARRGSSFVSVTTETIPQLKPGAPAVKRVCRRQGMIGPLYQNCVNNQRVREGKPDDFVAGPLRWGVHDGPYFLAHKGNRYLKLKEHGHGDDRWVDPATGSIIDVSVLLPYFRERSYGRQNLDKPVEWRTVRMDHLVSLKIDDLLVEVVRA